MMQEPLKTLTDELSELKLPIPPQSEKFQVFLSTGGCGAAGSCPTVYQASDGRFLLQGYRLSTEERSELSIPESEDVIALPAEFVVRLARQIEAVSKANV
jgi:hypothetical protein